MNNFSKFLCGAAFVALASHASAQVITYDLSNKDKGAVANPDYGLRLDGLMDGNSNIIPSTS